MHIWVDADACPGEIKELLFRAAKRTKTRVTLVANQPLDGGQPSDVAPPGRTSVGKNTMLSRRRSTNDQRRCTGRFAYEPANTAPVRTLRL